jgi:RND family efflux transporter MFP subunit
MALIWRIVRQAALGAAMLAAAVVLWARFLPASHVWLDRVGVLEPLRAAGLVPEAPAAAPPGAGPPGAAQGRGAVTVVAEPPGEQTAFDRVAAIGTGQARHAVTVTAEVAGRIAAIRVASGARVTAGEVIAELDREAQEIAVERARLVLADARDRRDRLGRLQATGAATDLQIREADLAVRQAELGLREATFALDRRTIRAPVTGHVGIIAVEAGEQVTPQTEIARIDDRTRLIVAFHVPERFVGRIGPGDVVAVRPLAFRDRELSGVVRALDNRVDPASRTILVQAELDNADDSLRAGMAFEIGIAVTGARHPTVPPLAVQWGTQGAFVWIVRAGRAARLPVRIVQRTAEVVLVDAAFEPGDLVVREGVQMLRPGADVSIAGAAAEVAAPRPRT